MSNSINTQSKKQSKRILIFSLAYHPVVGGAEIAVKEITDRIPDIEFDMVTKRFDKAHPEKERLGNVNVYRIDTSKTLFPIEAFMFARRLHADRPYDAIWSIMAAYAGFAALFFKMSFPLVPYILTLQEGDPVEHMKRRARFVSPLFRRIFTKADIVQVISNFLGGYASAMGYEGRIEVISNGVDVAGADRSQTLEEKNALRMRLGLAEDDVVLITTSRLEKKNGVADVINSLPLLPNNVKLVILGDGSLEEVLKLETRALGLEGRVKFLGFVPHEDLQPYLRMSDIFVRPSLSEGFGNSFIEAMAAELPVIATPVGGIVDFLYDPEENPGVPPTGLFAEVENPQSVANQIMRLVQGPTLRKQLVTNANKMVRERYDWNLIASEMRGRVFGI
jgi:glycosyltransferase involved in cell wall biosynthesis